MLLRSTKKTADEQRIYLGRTEQGAPVHMPPAIFEGVHSSDLTIIVGVTGSGKSMLKRAKIAQELWLKDSSGRTRAPWLFDGKGRDDYWGWLPNRNPKNKSNVILGTWTHGLPGYYFYFPVKGARAKAPWELICQPNFAKYSIRELEAMGFRGAAPKNLRDIMDKYGPFTSIEELGAFIDNYPTNPNRKASAKPPPGKPYREGDFLRSDTKNALARDFRHLVLDRGVWTMLRPIKQPDGTLKIIDFLITDNKGRTFKRSLEDIYLSGKLVVFSYNDTIVGRPETHHTLKKQMQLSDKYPHLPQPHDYIEEAHEMLDDDLIVDFVRTARKQGIALDLILPTLKPFAKKETSDVADDAKQWIVGKLKGTNRKLATEFISHHGTKMIGYLRMDRKKGIREFLYFNGDRDEAYGPFEAFECPQEYNRRV